jgi:NAD(P)-dependent dehydrogenase (short-subunit alcohol dehydrogenase family)
MKAPHSLVIGGTRGIGRELVDQFVHDGHKVSVIARHLPERETARKGVRYWPVDIRDEGALREALGRLIKESGKINHLIFFQRLRGAGDVWRDEIETSLTATKSVVELLQDEFAAGEKAIVLVSSINGKLIAGYLPIGYHVAKAALQQMARYWAIALGGRGIRVNSVSPGTVLKEESKQFFLNDKTISDLYRRITPLRRFGSAREVAKVIACLCGEQTSFVTGQDIVVDGGLSLVSQEALARELSDIASPPGNVDTATSHD